ncbi:molybdenum cofactor sulfurase-like [Amblyraja radiata]|uniref:molybdenum cofactor sulfurase-like n=1 Tax=Amblyraja radiata TaxID=386614 RepID=UPI001401FA81|nr:molybdenum cofactor sulfurase-like [Amblyraja radiata]
MEQSSPLPSQDWFQETFTQYDYGGQISAARAREFGRLSGVTYLDHGGATLYPHSQIHHFYQDLAENIYGNPHSGNIASRLTHDTIEHVRCRYGIKTMFQHIYLAFSKAGANKLQDGQGTTQRGVEKQ